MLSLGDKFGPLRLERASGIILSQTSSPSYSQIKSILENNLDVSGMDQNQNASNPQGKATKEASRRGYRRSADYFGGRDHAE